MNISDNQVVATVGEQSERKYVYIQEEDADEEVKYDLSYLTFVQPPQHQIDAISYDVELQIVHLNDDDEPLVISVLFDLSEGEPGNNWLMEDFHFGYIYYSI